MTYDAKKAWTNELKKQSIAYPSEYVIRIFKGSYPRLNFNKESFGGLKILDMGCGDGRNIPLLHEVGFEAHGTEISQEIVSSIKQNIPSECYRDIRVGSNSNIDYSDSEFDYLLSWNSCYYMGDGREFVHHVKEFSRVLKPGGTLVVSIPKKTCFIYKKSEPLKPGYQCITSDPFGVRNGEILRMFSGEDEIRQVFGEYFTDFKFASIHDDCFGFDYHWHLAVCTKR